MYSKSARHFAKLVAEVRPFSLKAYRATPNAEDRRSTLLADLLHRNQPEYHQQCMHKELDRLKRHVQQYWALPTERNVCGAKRAELLGATSSEIDGTNGFDSNDSIGLRQLVFWAENPQNDILSRLAEQSGDTPNDCKKRHNQCEHQAGEPKPIDPPSICGWCERVVNRAKVELLVPWSSARTKRTATAVVSVQSGWSCLDLLNLIMSSLHEVFVFFCNTIMVDPESRNFNTEVHAQEYRCEMRFASETNAYGPTAATILGTVGKSTGQHTGVMTKTRCHWDQIQERVPAIQGSNKWDKGGDGRSKRGSRNQLLTLAWLAAAEGDVTSIEVLVEVAAWRSRTSRRQRPRFADRALASEASSLYAQWTTLYGADIAKPNARTDLYWQRPARSDDDHFNAPHRCDTLLSTPQRCLASTRRAVAATDKKLIRELFDNQCTLRDSSRARTILTNASCGAHGFGRASMFLSDCGSDTSTNQSKCDV
ncbi:hypothetical protein BKA62DRAFT_675844 [Auriculariales sp. MPI-PUGE-AT-0066]|nr:hypothetical protein BKA62DRAFT_675844 [Auriculariales sp. MPI-PUGE-AT-0066]